MSYEPVKITEDDLADQKIWAQETFGPAERLQGVLAHIRKELEEIEADPQDLSEWVDVMVLTFDGAMRQGFTPAQILEGYLSKMQVNFARQWPDWRGFSENEAIEHVRD
jgi:hypothetical protein